MGQVNSAMSQVIPATTCLDHPSQIESTSGIQFRWLLAIAPSFTFATCYLREFVLPHAPVMSWNDQMLFASNGARIVAGQMPYRDYFQFVTPGADLVYAFLFRHLGLLLWIPNALMVCLASTAVLLMTLAAGKVLRGSFVALPAALTLGFVLFGGLDATHHWFSGLIALIAMLVLFQGSQDGSQDWRVALAGALCGLVASFTQSKGATVTAGFLVYLFWQAFDEKQKASLLWRRAILLCGAALMVFLAINGPYIAALGIKEWVKWVMVFPLRYYPTLPAQTWRSPLDDFRYQTGFLRWICIPFVYLTVPLVYLVFLRVMYRRRRAEPDEPWNQLLLLAITGLALFLAVAPCLSVMRVSCASLPGMVLLAWLLNRWGRKGRVAAGALAALSLAIAVYLPLRNQTMHWHYLDLPAGRTAILDPNRYEVYRWMAENTRPGQMYFGVGPLALPLWLQTPAPISSPVPYEYDRPEHIAASIAAIETNRVPLLLLKPYRYLAGTWGYTDEHLRPFQAYLDQHYRYVKTFPAGFELWQRRDSYQPDLKP
jgi:hypothetical protein